MKAQVVASRTDRLLQLLAGRKRMLLLTHTNPDPDSLASAMGLKLLAKQKLSVESDIALSGRIMRAENKEMVRCLGMKLLPMENVHLPSYDCLALVDTQPGFGHTLVPDGREIDIVIDHHLGPALDKDTRPPSFLDVRTDVGATSSIVTGYLMEAKVEVSKDVATALYYGIKTDTADLSRNVSALDEAAYEFLAEKIDRAWLAEIGCPALPEAYFSALRQALNNVRIYGNVILCSLGKIDSAEMVAEVADLLLRFEHKDMVFCGGAVDQTYYVSVRTELGTRDAFTLIREALNGEGSYGGHGSVAGGSISLPDDNPRTVRRLERRLEKNILRSMGVEEVPVEGIG